MKLRVFLFFFLVALIPLIKKDLAYCSVNRRADRERSEQSGFPVAEDFFQKLKQSSSKMEDAAGNEISGDRLVLERRWSGNVCRMTLKNEGQKAVRLSDIILFDIPDHNLPPESAVYGEGFQMLHQNGGTLAQRINIGGYADNKHYNIPEPHGLPTAYGFLEISVNSGEHLLLGFTSCKQFIGRISYDAKQMQISVDAEGLELRPGESWALEDFIFLEGNDRGTLLDRFSDEIVKNHPLRKIQTIPTGWCSWYCYGPDVTNKIIEDNLNSLTRILPELKYIQIDDGYQPFMGDWLDENPAYGDLRKTLAAIKAKGFEPAIWVAPFIAEPKSRIFKEHPDWFIRDLDGSPLNSSKVGFGGWRNGPWYVLDGTHPEVQKHLQHVFQVMREEWGVNYFKLDANYWGAIHGGVHFDKNATRIEAYRRGMEAILKGCDDQSVILGCNAPMWPSLGLVTAMRTSGDTKRDWRVIRKTAYENLHRTWQNGKLWDNDPDCVLLTNDTVFSGKKVIEPHEWLFHATAVHAVGGLILSGDKTTLLKDKELAILKKLLNPTGTGARFFDTKMETAVTDMGDIQYYYFFNWNDTGSIDLTVPLNSETLLTDFWSDKVLGVFKDSYTVTALPPHCAKLIIAKPR
jgi:alpha-galactosidase